MIAGWTICNNIDSDRPAYEADLLVCKHCGKTVFMCHAVTKKPLPASAVAERCNVCSEKICGRCKNDMRDGAVCRHFIDKIDAMEEAHRQYQRIGSW